MHQLLSICLASVMHESSLNSSSPFDNFYFELNDSRLWFITLQSIIGIVTVVGASVVLLLFYVTPDKSNGAARKYFIALALGDLQGGAILTTIFLYAATGVRVNDPFCIESISLMTYAVMVTLFLLVTMTIDRYFAILYPLKHILYAGSKIHNWVIAGCYFMGAVSGLGCYLTRKERSPHPKVLCFVTNERLSDYFSQPVIFLVVFPSIIVFVFGYVMIFRAIVTSMQSTSNKDQKTIKNLGKIVIRRNTPDSLKDLSAREVRATLILFLTIALFLLAWVPGPVGFIIYRYFPQYGTLNLGMIILLFMQLNSMVNPFLYARSVKDADKILIKCIKRCLCMSNK